MDLWLLENCCRTDIIPSVIPGVVPITRGENLTALQRARRRPLLRSDWHLMKLYVWAASTHALLKGLKGLGLRCRSIISLLSWIFGKNQIIKTHLLLGIISLNIFKWMLWDKFECWTTKLLVGGLFSNYQFRRIIFIQTRRFLINQINAKSLHISFSQQSHGYTSSNGWHSLLLKNKTSNVCSIFLPCISLNE